MTDGSSTSACTHHSSLSSTSPSSFPTSKGSIDAAIGYTRRAGQTAKIPPRRSFGAAGAISLYNGKGYYVQNNYNTYALNNVTAKKSKDGSYTIHFGGDPKQPNFLPITDGWNYIVRLYQPRKAVLDGTWKVPAPQPVKQAFHDPRTPEPQFSKTWRPGEIELVR
jgi:hypothetical protein